MDKEPKELLEKVKLLVREVLLNDKAMTEWINNADPDMLSALGAFARKFIEKDPNITKTDAFQQGVIIGAVYEHSRQKDKEEA